MGSACETQTDFSNYVSDLKSHHECLFTTEWTLSKPKTVGAVLHKIKHNSDRDGIYALQLCYKSPAGESFVSQTAGDTGFDLSKTYRVAGSEMC